MPLHAQIPFPAAVQRTAAIAADRNESAQEQIDEPTSDTGHRAIAAGAGAFGRGVARFVGTTATGSRERIHGLPTTPWRRFRIDCTALPSVAFALCCEVRGHQRGKAQMAVVVPNGTSGGMKSL